MSPEQGEKRNENIRLTWKDYAALFVASLETIMFPAVVLIVILLLLIIFSATVR
jgi:hypothetical protein